VAAVSKVAQLRLEAIMAVVMEAFMDLQEALEQQILVAAEAVVPILLIVLKFLLVPEVLVALELLL
jgi:hypothetical protein